MKTLKGIQIYSGSAHPELAKEVANYLGLELGQTLCTKFADGETRVQIEQSARRNDVYVIQPTCSPVNDTLVELGILLDSLKRASVTNLTAVIPYFGYARQDKKVGPREPITAKLVAEWIQVAGASQVITVDLHSDQTQGFFNVPVDNLMGGPTLGNYFLKKYAEYGKSKLVVVSPDVGGMQRASYLAKHMGVDTAVIQKSRPRPGVVEIGKIIGDVDDKICIMIDDMIDSGNTIVAGAAALIGAGAERVDVGCTHALLSNGAVDKLKNSVVREVVCLDTTPMAAKIKGNEDWITVLPSASLIGEAIKRHFTGESVSKLFLGWGK